MLYEYIGYAVIELWTYKFIDLYTGQVKKQRTKEWNFISCHLSINPSQWYGLDVWNFF